MLEVVLWGLGVKIQLFIHVVDERLRLCLGPWLRAHRQSFLDKCLACTCSSKGCLGPYPRDVYVMIIKGRHLWGEELGDGGSPRTEHSGGRNRRAHGAIVRMSVISDSETVLNRILLRYIEIRFILKCLFNSTTGHLPLEVSVPGSSLQHSRLVLSPQGSFKLLRGGHEEHGSLVRRSGERLWLLCCC